MEYNDNLHNVNPYPRNKRKSVLIIVMAIVIVLSLGYIGYNFHNDYVLGLQEDSYVQGANDGMLELYTNIIESATQCQQIPFAYGDNQTLNLIAVECLQQENNNGN